MHPHLNHFASPDYWTRYHGLPVQIRQTADKCFALLKADLNHPSLHLKKIGELWSVRVGIHYRAIGRDFEENGILWFWIGSHSEYNRFFKQK